MSWKNIDGEAFRNVRLVNADGVGPTVKPIITVVSVSVTKTLAELKGSALAATTRKVTLRPFATGIYFSGTGAASAASTPLHRDGAANDLVIDGTAESLADMEFYAAVATNMSVIEEA